MQRSLGIAPLIAILVLALGVTLGANRALGHAQESTSTPPPGAAPTTEVLGSGLPSDAPGMKLWLLRVTFAPGVAAGAHTHPGATVYHVDSGSLVFTLLEGEATIYRAAADPATPAASEPAELDTEIILNAGDYVFYEGDAAQTERNDGDEPAVVLISNLRGEDEPARQGA